MDLGELIDKLVTTGEAVVKRLPGIRQVLVLYPYVLASGCTVVARGSGGYETRSAFVLNAVPPLCHDGYDPKEQRSPTDGSNRPMDVDARRAAPPTRSNPRGSQDAPRVSPGPLAAGEPAEDGLAGLLLTPPT